MKNEKIYIDTVEGGRGEKNSTLAIYTFVFKCYISTK